MRFESYLVNDDLMSGLRLGHYNTLNLLSHSSIYLMGSAVLGIAVLLHDPILAELQMLDRWFYFDVQWRSWSTQSTSLCYAVFGFHHMCSCALQSNISTLISSVQRTLLQRSCGMFILNIANLNCAVLFREKSRPPGNVSKQANPFLIAVSWSFKFNILTEVCRVWGVAAVSLNIAWTDLGLNLLNLWLCVNTHLNAPHWQIDKTSAFTEVLTPADDPLIKCIWSASPGCYLPS